MMIPPKMCNSLAAGSTLGLLLSCILMILSTHSSESSNSASSSSHQISPVSSSLAKHKTPHLDNNPAETLNVIDSCWRLTGSKWSSNPQSLADCAVGFGRAAAGGRDGKIYTVTDSSDNAIDPKPGTLRYGAIQEEPLWIIFSRDMVITLDNELMLNSNKTIDGRGFNVEITKGPCITVEKVEHIIVHGISIHDCLPGRPGLVRTTPTHQSRRIGSDGDGIKITDSSHIWIDHCFLSSCVDGLIDAVHTSKNITISNSRFTNHVKVMLLGSLDGYEPDRDLQVTLAFNYFGPGLSERMPRLRYGYVHVANNYYEPWLLYAIGGSSEPTILSESNYFVASDNPKHKEITRREAGNEDGSKWNWTSNRDMFINAAHFTESGIKNGDPPYTQSQKFIVADGSLVPTLTSEAGPLHCSTNDKC